LATGGEEEGKTVVEELTSCSTFRARRESNTKFIVQQPVSSTSKTITSLNDKSTVTVTRWFVNCVIFLTMGSIIFSISLSVGDTVGNIVCTHVGTGVGDGVVVSFTVGSGVGLNPVDSFCDAAVGLGEGRKLMLFDDAVGNNVKRVGCSIVGLGDGW
jgi:hypothetical protein